jgi:nicotinamide-nucleotide amidase
MTLAADLIARCADRDLTIATAESLTAGLLASTLAEVPGCSAVLRGGVIAYATQVKATVLGLPEAALEHVVSEQVAEGLARAATSVLAADIGIGTTGVAGPDWLDGQSPGTVWIAVHHGASGRTRTRLLALEGDRMAIRVGTVHACLLEALALLDEIHPQ